MTITLATVMSDMREIMTFTADTSIDVVECKLRDTIGSVDILIREMNVTDKVSALKLALLYSCKYELIRMALRNYDTIVVKILSG